MRCLGIDHGTVRIGLALGDPLAILASPLETISAQPENSALDRIGYLVLEHGVTTLVLGLPLNFDGTSGSAVTRVEAFADKLRNRLPACEIQFVDERLSSREARDRKGMKTKRGGGKSNQQKGKAETSAVDAFAAVIILQDYLDQRQGMALLPDESWE